MGVEPTSHKAAGFESAVFAVSPRRREVVPEGVEPSCREASPPQDDVYTNSTTEPKSGWQDLNLRPLAPHAIALPNCATPRKVSDGTRTRIDLDHNQGHYLSATLTAPPLGFEPSHQDSKSRVCIPQQRREVRPEGVEPSIPLGHMGLNHARIPIPPETR